MTCSRCKKTFEAGQSRCPHCGEPTPTGLFQTSTVLISTGAADLVYRSVDEVPARLRTKLLKSTAGANSATILIADRRGRREIAKAMRNLPGPVQRRWMNTLMATEAAASAIEWLTPARRRAILIAITLLAAIAIVFVFTR